MPWEGRFDDTHTATLDFNLHRIPDGKQFQTTGIIDTGFTGFVQIPRATGEELGYVDGPRMYARYFLANREEQEVIVTLANVTVGRETRNGACLIPLAGDSLTLIGMDFLRRFHRKLIISYRTGIRLEVD
ncbi:MAG: hypothetical protein OXH76_24845 [Boseongicola sp.]|nr:hypothetical protein [Boseongicola sp.]